MRSLDALWGFGALFHSVLHTPDYGGEQRLDGRRVVVLIIYAAALGLSFG